MFQWRKFDFFEEKSVGKSSSSISIPSGCGKIECCSSGRGRVVVGCDDGTVAFLDRGFKLLYAFQAHADRVLFLHHLKQRNFLVTVGGDEELSCLKIFDLDKMEPEGSSMTSPICVQTLRIFTNQYPQAKESTSTMRKEMQDLTTAARIFQLSKCTACTFTLDLPAVHFMCMHSFHLRCLGDNEKECPECTPEYKSVIETKRNLEQIAKDQNQFFHQVKNSKDGFSVIADYFGKGIVSKTSIQSKRDSSN